MPGLRFQLWLVYAVTKHPWVQVPAGQIGVVLAQVGEPLPIGAKSAIYRPEFGNFTDLRVFIEKHGQKGVQRPVLSPGTLAPIHPLAFLVITKPEVFGVPTSSELSSRSKSKGELSFRAFGLDEKQLDVTRISPRPTEAGKVIDMIGIVTALEGDPLPAGDIASRLGGFSDIHALEAAGDGATATDARLFETILGNQNDKHSAYQDFQRFLDFGGKIGLQHDPLLYGAYNLNPFLLRVEEVPMLVVEQGQVAVMKAYVGLPTQDTSGVDFKFGSLVRPGHRGIWQEPLRTGKCPINPRCYQAVIVPTFIITLNWADVVSQAHNLDAQLKQIEAKSSEGFHFAIDLQVQIHIPDTQAPYVISMVGSVANLVNEVLQAAVGNHFRNKLQSMPAVSFIATREAVQQGAYEYVKAELSKYRVETRGVYIQAVVPAAAVGRSADRAGDREPGSRDLQDAAVGAGPAHRNREGQGHRRHAGRSREVAGRRGHPDQSHRRTQDGSAGRGDLHRADRRRTGRAGAIGGPGARRGLPTAGGRARRERDGGGERARSALEEHRAVRAEYARDGRRRQRHARRRAGAADAADRRGTHAGRSHHQALNSPTAAGGHMAKFLIQVAYTPQAWASMIKNPHDRTQVLKPVLEKLGGSIELSLLHLRRARHHRRPRPAAEHRRGGVRDRGERRRRDPIDQDDAADDGRGGISAMKKAAQSGYVAPG